MLSSSTFSSWGRLGGTVAIPNRMPPGSVLLPFIKEGFEGGENASHIVDPKRRAEHLERLRSAGIDTTLLQQSGRFVLRDWADAHLKDGRFAQEKMLDLAETMM
jgi:DcmR-like sensory protein